MAVMKYKDPVTGEVKKVGAPALESYSKAEVDAKVENKVPITRTINNKALSTDVTLGASDVGAAPAIHADQHISSDTITWDGVAGDRLVVTVTDSYGSTMHFVHMSDATPSWSALYGKATTAWTTPSATIERVADDDQLEQLSDNVIWFGFNVFAASDNASCELDGVPLTFPQKGIYLGSTLLDGETFYTSRLTVPGYNFGDATDPITPDMICAAPANHASADAKYGMATPDMYGHVKAAWLDRMLSLGTTKKGQDPNLWYDVNGNLIGDDAAAEEYLRGIVPNMWLMSLLGSSISLRFDESDAMFKDLNEQAHEHENKTVLDGITATDVAAWNAKSGFSGSYNDLTDKPTIFSGNYNHLTNKPTIPSALADLTTDSTHRIVTDAEKAAWNAKSNFSGSYNDLTNKPSIPSISGLATETYVNNAVSSKANSSHTQAASTITAGTFAGAVVAQASTQTPGTSLLRNSKLVSTQTNPSSNGEICWTYA